MSDKSEKTESICHTFSTSVSPDRAFKIFTAELGEWWPREYTWSGDVLEDIGIEQEEGGFCYERGPHGFLCYWGRVLKWDLPKRLLFSWQISPTRVPEPDPDKASEVEVEFKPEHPSGTSIIFEHRHLERHGDEGAAYRDGLASPQGWPYILERFKNRLDQG